MYAPQPQSTLEQNKQLLARWFEEVWNQGHREVIHKVFGADAVFRDGKNTYRGPDGFCEFYDAMRKQFSNFSIKPIVGLAEHDLVCSHVSVECEHIESKTKVQFTAIAIVRVANGQFAEAWQNWDQASLAAQLAA
jgi:predicted SnoaL-like aldol condensation-catalyzing enzyme